MERIEVLTSSSLTLTDRQSIFELCERVFKEDLRTLFGTYQNPVHLIVRNGSKMVSHACLIERWLQVMNSPPMRTGFVEAVATDPEYEGRGFGSAVMRRIMIEAENAAFEIGGLSTSRSFL